ncbi:YczE/YyaS/YitT family protein [Pontibacter vulgaris]|uniref:YczE/YyaS/YitT family protein n=1 Tax=Pontibacter vulgaris TaxID=2905679 RepID=UPI001FA7C939|nr:YitT family protein [Pontibacter vulgaris]
MKQKAIDYGFFLTGMAMFGLGNALAVQVKYLGLHPWEVLNMALFQKFGFSLGTWSTIVGLVFVIISWFMNRKYVNIGTFLNALLIGPFTDLFLWLDFLPKATDTWLDFLILGSTLVIGGIAGGLYVAAGIGAGPRDGFMLSISERTRLSVSNARILVELIVLGIGYVMGGPAFIASFFYTLIQSPIFQFTLKFFRNVRMSMIEKREKEKTKVCA